MNPLSPRTKYAQKLQLEEEMLNDLSMNFDPFTISLLKKEFELRNDSLKLEQFVVILKEHLNHWRDDLPDRETVLVNLLVQLFEDIDMNGNGELDWDEFTNYIIEKANTINKQKFNQIDSIKNYSLSSLKLSFSSEKGIQKLINLEDIDRFGVIEEYSDTIQFFHPETGQVVGHELQLQFQDKKNPLNSSFKSDRKAVIHDALYISELQVLLTSTNDCLIRTWVPNGSIFHDANTEGGYPILTSKSPQSKIVWNPVHKIIYGGDSYGNISLWFYSKNDKRVKDPFKVLKNGHTEMVTDLLPLPKLESLISCSSDHKVILWDMISGSPRRFYNAHKMGVLSLAFNEEYRLLFTAGFDHDIYVWNPYIDTVAFTIEGHNSSLLALEVIPGTPQIVSADLEGWVKVWDIRNLSCVQSFNLGGNQGDFGDFIHFSRYKKLLFGGKTLAFYEYDKNHDPNLVDDNQPLSAFYTSVYHKILTPTHNKVKVWNALTGLNENLFAVYAESEICCVEMDEWEKRMFVGDTKGRTRVYNIRNGAFMKRLGSHKGEINCISNSEKMQVIVTASMDFTFMIHDDTSLTDSSVLRCINSGETIVQLVETLSYLDIVLIGNSEGEVQLWDIDDQSSTVPTLNHFGEITAIQVVKDYPFVIVCDSSGEVAFWALHPLPFKQSQLLNFYNLDEEGDSSAVQATAYSVKTHQLYTGDERGCIRVYDVSPLVKLLKMKPLTGTGKANKCLSVLSKAELGISELPQIDLPQLLYIKPYSEGIRYLHVIEEPATVLSTSFERKVKLHSVKDGKEVGALQQGGATRSLHFKVPWLLDLNVKALKAAEASKTRNFLERIKPYAEDSKKFSNESLKAISEFQSEYQLNDASQNYKVSLAETKHSKKKRSLELLDKYSIKNAKKGRATQGFIGKSDYTKYVPKGFLQKNISPRHKKAPESKNFPSARILQSVPSLPSISRNKFFCSKLSKGAINSACNLASALDEPYF